MGRHFCFGEALFFLELCPHLFVHVSFFLSNLFSFIHPGSQLVNFRKWYLRNGEPFSV